MVHGFFPSHFYRTSFFTHTLDNGVTEPSIVSGTHFTSRNFQSGYRSGSSVYRVQDWPGWFLRGDVLPSRRPCDRGGWSVSWGRFRVSHVTDPSVSPTSPRFRFTQTIRAPSTRSSIHVTSSVWWLELLGGVDKNYLWTSKLPSTPSPCTRVYGLIFNVFSLTVYRSQTTLLPFPGTTLPSWLKR